MTPEEEKKEQLKMDYLETFTSPAGKRVLADLRRLSHFDLSIIPTGNDGHIDVYNVMRNEGMRAVLIHILRKIEPVEIERQTEAKKE